MARYMLCAEISFAYVDGYSFTTITLKFNSVLNT